MKIIAWNCNMAYRKKAAAILSHQPDIVVVPECECPDNLAFGVEVTKPADILWFGRNKHKGLGIFSYSNWRFRLLDDHNESLRMIVPVEVCDGKERFILFAIWANNPDDKDGQYVTQVWKAIHHYEHLFKNVPVVLAGDFNSNTIWDRKSRIGNHSDVVKFLEERNIHSAYHAHHQMKQGKEAHPTHYLYRHENKPYHLDYCFVSSPWFERITEVEIGSHANWSAYSDHVPVMVTIEPPLNLPPR